MLFALAFTATTFTAPAPSANAFASNTSIVREARDDDEYDKRRKEAGDDVAKLWELYEWCDAYGKKKEARKTLIRIVKLEPNHRDAREALGHVG